VPGLVIWCTWWYSLDHFSVKTPNFDVNFGVKCAFFLVFFAKNEAKYAFFEAFLMSKTAILDVFYEISVSEIV